MGLTCRLGSDRLWQWDWDGEEETYERVGHELESSRGPRLGQVSTSGWAYVWDTLV
jgi:hypothetical protein